MKIKSKFLTAAVSRVKETASSKIEETADSVSGRVDAAKEQASIRLRYTATSIRHPIRFHITLANKVQNDPFGTVKGLTFNDPDLLEEVIEETTDFEERRAISFATMSYQQFVDKGAQIKPAIASYGSKAIDISREINPEKSYRYGTYAAKAGAKYGDYVPVVGDFAPHLGFGLGALLGAADSLDAIEAEGLLDIAKPASDAADEMIDDETGKIRYKIFKGGVAYADSRFGRSSEPHLDHLLTMEYEDFAGKGAF